MVLPSVGTTCPFKYRAFTLFTADLTSSSFGTDAGADSLFELLTISPATTSTTSTASTASISSIVSIASTVGMGSVPIVSTIIRSPLGDGVSSSASDDNGVPRSNKSQSSIIASCLQGSLSTNAFSPSPFPVASPLRSKNSTNSSDHPSGSLFNPQAKSSVSLNMASHFWSSASPTSFPSVSIR